MIPVSCLSRPWKVFEISRRLSQNHHTMTDIEGETCRPSRHALILSPNVQCSYTPKKGFVGACYNIHRHSSILAIRAFHSRLKALDEPVLDPRETTNALDFASLFHPCPVEHRIFLHWSSPAFFVLMISFRALMLSTAFAAFILFPRHLTLFQKLYIPRGRDSRLSTVTSSTSTLLFYSSSIAVET